jgi:hypothetical protein
MERPNLELRNTGADGKIASTIGELIGLRAGTWLLWLGFASVFN